MRGAAESQSGDKYEWGRFLHDRLFEFTEYGFGEQERQAMRNILVNPRLFVLSSICHG
jgi:hypothetical protein